MAEVERLMLPAPPQHMMTSPASAAANSGEQNSTGATPSAGPAAAGQQAPSPEMGSGHRQSDDDSGCALEEYTWVPQGLKPEQVSQNGSFTFDFPFDFDYAIKNEVESDVC